MAEEQVKPTVNSIEIASNITIAWLSNPNVNAAASDVPTVPIRLAPIPTKSGTANP